MKAIKAPQLLVIVAVALLALTGCASSEKATEQGTPASTHAAALSIKDPWVKSADRGMSAAFGTLQNTGAADITIVSASTPASTAVELHETVPNAAGEMVMRKKAGGFVIPAGGSFPLA
ncbi:MAG: copper chaperone PCu(A)C, partial [Mycobacteriaceae bacterium]